MIYRDLSLLFFVTPVTAGLKTFVYLSCLGTGPKKKNGPVPEATEEDSRE